MRVAHIPRAIRRRGDILELEWDDRAAHVTRLAMRAVRLACPCAACVDEMTGRALLDPATVPADVRADAVELVGAYGVRICWSDGHATGIYTFRVLRDMCTCDACRAARS